MIAIVAGIVVPLVCMILLLLFTVVMPALRKKISSDTEVQVVLKAIQKASEENADTSRDLSNRVQSYIEKNDERYFQIHEDVALLQRVVYNPKGQSNGSSNLP